MRWLARVGGLYFAEFPLHILAVFLGPNLANLLLVEMFGR